MAAATAIEQLERETIGHCRARRHDSRFDSHFDCRADNCDHPPRSRCSRRAADSSRDFRRFDTLASRSLDGDYRFHSSRRRPRRTHDDLRLAIAVDDRSCHEDRSSRTPLHDNRDAETRSRSFCSRYAASFAAATSCFADTCHNRKRRSLKNVETKRDKRPKPTAASTAASAASTAAASTAAGAVALRIAV